MSTREYLRNFTVEELEYVRLVLEVDPTMTVIKMMKIIKKRREDE